MNEAPPYSGPELVALTELLYRRAFTVVAYAVLLTSGIALAVLPWRKSAPGTDWLSPTVLLTFALVVAAPIAAQFAGPLQRLVRRRLSLELAIVAVAALLASYPLRSELWWPACALLMLVATQASLLRSLGYCLVVLLTNLLAHVVAGDLDEIPGVAVIGLWIGIPLWVGGTSALMRRAAMQLLTLNRDRWPALEPGPVAQTPGDGLRLPWHLRGGTGPDLAALLTPRQLEVVALLTQGMIYNDVAAALGVTERTVQRHVREAVVRVAAENPNALVALAAEQGIVPASAA